MMNSDDDFKSGGLVYEADFQDPAPAELDLSQWRDGYVAFSRGEKRISELGGVDVESLLSKGSENIPGAQGIVIEIGLWRNDNGVFEEVSIEREDGGFFRQYWRLSEEADGEEADCYFRHAGTRARKGINRPGLFGDEGDLNAVEVIVPKKRLHFYITRGE